MKSYLRFLSRNKLYTAIMAVGLSVSLAFVIIMSCFVWQNLSVNRYYPESDKIYNVGFDGNSMSSFTWGPAIVDKFPEAEKSVTVLDRYGQWSIGDVQAKEEKFMGIDPDFFEMFPTKVIYGDLEGFNDFSNVIITKSFADRLGGEEAVGMLLSDDFNGREYRICAVIEGFEETFFENTEVILNTRAPRFDKQRDQLFNSASGGTLTFIKVTENADIEALGAKLDEMYENGLREEQRNGKRHFNLTRLDRLYLSEIQNFGGLKKGNKGLLSAFSIISIFLLISAVFNYINLSTALAGKRSRETATRMLLGEPRRNVFVRSIIESVCFTAICMGIAFIIADLCLPTVNRLINSPIPIEIKFSQGHMYLYMLILGTTSVICGIVPSFISLRFKPIEIIKGQYRHNSKKTFSKIFIVLQNTLAVIIIAVSMVMGGQIRHMVDMPLGGNTHGLYLASSVIDNLEKLIAEQPFTGRIGRADGRPGGSYMRLGIPTDDKELQINVCRCDTVAFELFGFRIVEDYGIGTGAWLTESAFNMSVENPSFRDYLEWIGSDGTIAGVIEDVSFSNAKELNTDAVGVVLCSGQINGNYIIELPDPTEENIRVLDMICREETLKAKGPYYPVTSGYLPEIIAKEYEEMNNQFTMVILFMIIAIMLSSLGQIAMSTYYATEREKEISIRKVFGGTVRSESIRNISEYMAYCLVACVIGIPSAIWIAGLYLETFVYKMPQRPWIYIVAAVSAFAISFGSVLWQTLRAARTNPAEALKKE